MSSRWQNRLLPLMAAMLVAGALLFAVALLVQYTRISTWMTAPTAAPDARMWDPASLRPASFDERLTLARQRAEYALECEVIRRRYEQNGQAIATRLWARFMGFMTGMIMAITGAAFILGKLEDKGSEIGGGDGVRTLSIKSASPGIVLAALGTALIALTLAIQVTVNVRDVPVYFGGSALPLLAGATVPPAAIPAPIDPADGDGGPTVRAKDGQSPADAYLRNGSGD